MYQAIRHKFKFFKRCDIFGYPVALTMKNEDSYKTVFGGILTTLINFFFVSVIVYSFYMLFTKQTLQTAKYELNLGANYGLLNLSDQNYMIAIKFDANNLNNWTNPYINVTMQHVTQFRNTTNIWKIKKPINLKVCEKTDFPGLEQDFDQLGLNNSLCPIKGTQMPLQGNFQENLFAYSQIILTTCSNKNVCQSNSTIYSTISAIDKLKIQFFITNNIVDERNYEKPITRQIVADMHFLIDPIKSVYRTSDIFLNEIEITTDGGVFPSLFPTAENNFSYTYNQEFREQTVFTALDGSQRVNIGDFYFRKSQTKYKYNRYLGNLLTVLSYLGGIWSTVHIAFTVIAKPYSRNFFLNTLANKLYNYPSQMKRRTKKSKTMEERPSQTYNSGTISPELNNEARKSMYSKIMNKIETYLSYDRKLKLSFCDMWRFLIQRVMECLNFKDEKYVLIKKTQENLSRDLDICNILKKLHEIDKIKDILFSEEQQLILGFSPKPDVFSSEVDPNILQLTSSGLKSLSKSIRSRKSRRKKTRLLEDEVNFDDIKPFKQLIFAWKTLKTTKQTELLINENLVKMFGEDFSKTVDITEEEMQMIFNQSKSVGNKFLNLVKVLKQESPKSNKKPEGFIKKDILHDDISETFVDAPETDVRLVVVGNKIERVEIEKLMLKELKNNDNNDLIQNSERRVTFVKQKSLKKQLHSKLNNIKDRLGIGHLKNDLEKYEDDMEGDQSSQRIQLDTTRRNENGSLIPESQGNSFSVTNHKESILLNSTFRSSMKAEASNSKKKNSSPLKNIEINGVVGDKEQKTKQNN